MGQGAPGTWACHGPARGVQATREVFAGREKALTLLGQGAIVEVRLLFDMEDPVQPSLHPHALFRPAYRPRPSASFGVRALAVLIVAGTLAVLGTVLGAAPVRAQDQPVHDFDRWCKWRRGAQTWGTLTQSKEQVHEGAFAGKLAYDFPEGEEASFVVFQCAKPLAGRPESLSVWVYGDGSGNLLNAWVQDATGLRWQFSFGPMEFTGWQQLTADLVPGQPWPNGPLDGSDADAVAYPIRFDGFALDNPGTDAAQGEIYLDDLQASSGADSESSSESDTESGAAQPTSKLAAATPTPAPAAGADSGRGAPASEGAAGSGDGGSGDGAAPAQDPEVDFQVDASSIEAGQCTNLRWTVRHVRQYFVDGEGKAGDTGEQEVCPEATTTYTLRVKTLAGEQKEYTVEVEVVGEPSGAPAAAVTGEPPGMAPGESGGESGDQITVDDAEVLEEPLDLKGVNDISGIEAVAIADCGEARKLKCTDMSQYKSNPSFGKSTKACLVWVEQGTTFGAIDIAVRRESPDPQKELWTSSRDSLGNFACIGVPVKIGQKGSYAAVLTAKGANKAVKWRIK